MNALKLFAVLAVICLLVDLGEGWWISRRRRRRRRTTPAPTTTTTTPVPTTEPPPPTTTTQAPTTRPPSTTTTTTPQTQAYRRNFAPNAPPSYNEYKGNKLEDEVARLLDISKLDFDDE
uniref:salivary glue protein Sgs-3-like isoform X2 n=1 Tax=Ciona intestinalis TaxID=7719 RepID=UPI000180B16A|nr:salivary glue protein Sgs-3-like isoform X2 [Ciona intestinalis]|eukprot:XP_009861193.1 salivary glue protein Sgs-3-like isoform X2 [Ciona intestinalis]